MKKRGYILAAVFLTAVQLAAGCGGMGSKDAGSADRPGENGAYEMATEDAAMQDADLAEKSETEEKASAGETLLEGSGADEAANKSEKLIYTYNYSVETKEFEKFTEQITSKTAQLGGYVQNSEISGSAADGVNRSANLILRIPAGRMNQMTNVLDTQSNVTYRNTSTENVTLQYVDMESHVKALRTEQETLLRLIEKAEKLEDVITLQSQLTQVRYEIESYETQLRMYDNRVEYSTLYLDIFEVERTTTVASMQTGFAEEIKNRFSDNMYAVGQWLRAAAVWLIGSLPVFVPLAVLFIAAVLIFKRIAKRRNNRTSVHGEEEKSGYRSIYHVQKEVNAEPSDAAGTQPKDADTEMNKQEMRKEESTKADDTKACGIQGHNENAYEEINEEMNHKNG